MNINKAKISLLFVGDIAILYLSLFLTILIRYGFADLKEKWVDHLLPFTIVFLAWLLVFYLFELYSPKAFKSKFDLLKMSSGAILISFLISIVTFYTFGSFFSLSPKTNLIIFTIIFGLVNFSWRAFLQNIFLSKKWIIKVLAIGNSPVFLETLESIKKNPSLGYRIEREVVNNFGEQSVTELVDFSKRSGVEIIVLDRTAAKEKATSKLAYDLLPSGIQTKNFIDFYEEIFKKIPLEELGEKWFIREINTSNKLNTAIKRIIDFALALAFSIILLPVNIVIAVLIKITSRGPALFKQTRVGRQSKFFTLYKWRTMVKDAEKDGAKWAEKRDSRITKIGRFLRYTHLDEMPQLWNILRGDISFVGPRPERPEFTEKLREEIPHYEMRHIVKPGLTGWAQISYRYGATVEDAAKKLEYDLYYLKNRSLTLDILTILKTIKMIFKNH